MSKSLKGSKMVKKPPSSTKKGQQLTTITIQRGGEDPETYCFWDNSPTWNEQVYKSTTDNCRNHPDNRKITKYEYNNHMKSDNNIAEAEQVEKAITAMFSETNYYYKTFDVFMDYYKKNYKNVPENIDEKVINKIINILAVEKYKFKPTRERKTIYDAIKKMKIEEFYDFQFPRNYR